jgi:hypothetical protein
VAPRPKAPTDILTNRSGRVNAPRAGPCHIGAIIMWTHRKYARDYIACWKDGGSTDPDKTHSMRPTNPGHLAFRLLLRLKLPARNDPSVSSTAPFEGGRPGVCATWLL